MQSASKTTGEMPCVNVLLTTHNGSAFIEAQLRSLAEQTGVTIRLHWADDASDDDTQARVVQHAAELGLDLVAYSVQGGSATRCFLSLVSAVADSAGFFAFCDQDDVWFKDKLAEAVARLGPPESTTPMLYCARTEYVDAELRHLGFSPLWNREPGLQTALAQNIAAGNTVVMNRAAFFSLKQVADLEVPAHDWAAYLAVSAVGGGCIFDPIPRLAYRQHGHNVIGSGVGMCNRWRRVWAGFMGGYAHWNSLNRALLARLKDRIPAAQLPTIADFDRACFGRSPWGRVAALQRSGVRRMRPASQLAFYLAAWLGRL